MEKALTFGIAVRNIKEEYLRKCVESVAANKSPHIEIIIVDDFSDDDCGKICREYAKSDERIKYIKNEKNIGIGAVRNKIIDEASGDWILFVDGDDVVSETFTDSFIEIFKNEYDVMLFGYTPFDTSDAVPAEECDNSCSFTILTDETVRNAAISAISRYEIYGEETKKQNIHPNTVLATAYRKSFLKRCGVRFDPSLKTAEDSTFNCIMYLSNPKTVKVTKNIYFYRLHRNSVTKRFNAESKKTTDGYLKAIGDIVKTRFSNDGKVSEYVAKYRCTSAVTDNFERNIFHKDNKKSYSERRADFLSLLSEEPYKGSLRYADEIENHKQRLVLKLAKRKWFFALDFAYRHALVFKLYGGISNRINKLKKR